MFLNEDGFYSVRLLASRQTPQLEDHSWSAVHDCLFNIFAANLQYGDDMEDISTDGIKGEKMCTL